MHSLYQESGRTIGVLNLYWSSMDQEQAIQRARQFAHIALTVEIEKLSQTADEQRAALRRRPRSARLNTVGNHRGRDGKIRGGQVTAMLDSRLNLLLEGFELHGVVIDDNLRDRVVAELTALRTQWTANALEAMKQDNVLRNGPVQPAHFLRQLEQAIGLRPNEVRTRIERARLKPRGAGGGIINIYHINGSNNRWLNNSQDHSVNIVTQSSDQIFTTIRQEIVSTVPAGDEQKDVLERLTALEQAQNSPSFTQRYMEGSGRAEPMRTAEPATLYPFFCSWRRISPMAEDASCPAAAEHRAMCSSARLISRPSA